MSMSYDDIDCELAWEEEMKKENEGVIEIVLTDNEKLYIDVDSDVIAQAEEICNDEGYTLEEAIKNSIETIAESGKLPFFVYEETDENESARIETEKLLNNNTAPSYNSAEELLEEYNHEETRPIEELFKECGLE
jgi:antitoxin component of RelBE/YafQ-DinJ toxin-antitoxin module